MQKGTKVPCRLPPLLHGKDNYNITIVHTKWMWLRKLIGLTYLHIRFHTLTLQLLKKITRSLSGFWQGKNPSLRMTIGLTCKRPGIQRWEVTLKLLYDIIWHRHEKTITWLNRHMVSVEGKKRQNTALLVPNRNRHWTNKFPLFHVGSIIL